MSNLSAAAAYRRRRPRLVQSFIDVIFNSIILNYLEIEYRSLILICNCNRKVFSIIAYLKVLDIWN